MDELEKLGWIIAQEFVRAYDELLLSRIEEDEEEDLPLTRTAAA